MFGNAPSSQDPETETPPPSAHLVAGPTGAVVEADGDLEAALGMNSRQVLSVSLRELFTSAPSITRALRALRGEHPFHGTVWSSGWLRSARGAARRCLVGARIVRKHVRVEIVPTGEIDLGSAATSD